MKKTKMVQKLVLMQVLEQTGMIVMAVQLKMKARGTHQRARDRK